MSSHFAVIGDVPFPVFSNRTTVSPPARGPAHTCSGNEVSTVGGGGGEGGAVCTDVARHHGVFVGKLGSAGKSVEPPFPIFVIAEVI